MYHIALNLTDKKVTIVGGGKVAYRKALGLVHEKCVICVIAPEFIKEFHRLDGKVHKMNKRYEKGDCEGSTLVFAATNDAKLNTDIKKDCEALHILCNVVNNQVLSDFTTPAQVRRGELTLSVTTNGKSPALAKAIKNELALLYDDTYQEKVALLGQIRTYLLKEEDKEQSNKQLTKIVALDNEALRNYLNQLIEGGEKNEICTRQSNDSDIV